MILEPPSKAKMDILNIATQTVIKSLLSFFEEMGMMGRSIEYPTAMVNDGLAGYRILFGDDWKEFQFTNPLKKEVGYSPSPYSAAPRTYTEPTIRQTVQDVAQKKNLIANPSYPTLSSRIAKDWVTHQMNDLVKKTNSPILLIQTQPDYIWGFYYDPQISFIGDFNDAMNNNYYLEVSHAVKFAIASGKPNTVYIKTPTIYNGCFDSSCYKEIFSSNPSYSPNNLTYKDYSEITGSTTYRLGDNWGGYRTKIFQGFRDTNKNAMFLYVLEPKPTSLMNWNSVPWDNNSK